MRNFIRHPTRVPIDVVSLAGSDAAPGARGAPTGAREIIDVGEGGLAFQLSRALEPGTLVRVRIALVDPAFETLARVVWCRPARPGFQAGAAFVDAADAFRARMVEQVCHIESYRQQVLEREHRALSSEAAATEWIARFAARFPGADAGGRH